MEVLLLAVMAASNILCFMIGAKVGQQVAKGEEVKLPTVNPIQAIKEREAKKAAQAEQERIDAVMRNVERYDGTSNGQEDIPH